MENNIRKLFGLNVLVVEDDSFQRHALTQILKRVGVITIMSATDGEEALELIKSHAFDVVICDLSMPNMDGLALIRRLSECDYKGSILLLSAMEESLLRSAAKMVDIFNLNMLAALSKPVKPAELTKALLKHFEQSQHSQNTKPTIELSAQELDIALAQQKIMPYFQPQVSLHDGTLLGFESLARWQHPSYGLVAPDYFIELAEKTDQIHQLTELMFRESICQLNTLSDMPSPVKLAINVSHKNLESNAIQTLLINLDKNLNNKNHKITIEITEQTTTKNPAMALEVISRFRMHGFNMSIDDFGTGYSSMEQLSELPFNELKIDRQFVGKMDTDKNALIIVESCIRLAKRLKLKTIAEGVENATQWRLLKRLGCDYCQGYLISKPVPVEQISEKMNAWYKTYTTITDEAFAKAQL
ncbi:EAL domain-containing response regulator [Colwellia piezophila]|uniref:EAL domain-containing response regulator n=1 Tax=Colwellia piezophila TaxID=211668 RepID=UPI00037A4FA0|nr:EAL domain-containing response regulator [Colwellia piezophila]